MHKTPMLQDVEAHSPKRLRTEYSQTYKAVCRLAHRSEINCEKLYHCSCIVLCLGEKRRGVNRWLQLTLGVRDSRLLFKPTDRRT
jgi:hypothetical protein